MNEKNHGIDPTEPYIDGNHGIGVRHDHECWD